MIKIDIEEPRDEDWSDWRNLCNTATDELIEARDRGEELAISNLYKKQKHFFFDINGPFHGKCVYCESLIQVTQPGDVEHYRPKGRVQDEDNQLVMTDDGNGNEIPHPGYYWLAYDWKNLLPSCIDCNRPRKHSVNGEEVRYGKWDQFPVREFRASNPGEESNEEPLLLNPVIDCPEDHFDIDDLGILIPKTYRGQKCIDVFGLNDRISLVQERCSVYDDVRDKIVNLVSSLSDNAPNVPRRITELIEVKAGKKAYSIAGRAALKNEKHIFQPLFDLLDINIA